MTKLFGTDGARPGTNAAGDGWSVTYALQRSTTLNDNNSWKWLSEYGADVDSPFANDAGELASSLLKATISGTGADATATFENLPKTDVNGKEYTYRLVEKVVGSYKVEGAPVGSSVDGKVQLVAVGVGANAPGASDLYQRFEYGGHIGYQALQRLWHRPCAHDA